MKPKHLLVLFAGLTATMTVGGELVSRLVDDRPPQTSPAIVTDPPAPTILIAPITVATTTTSTTTDAPKTAHEAMQADLGTLIAPNTPCQEWAPLALEVGWPAEQLQNLLEEMWQESRCQSDVISSANDNGLMQINTVWRDEFEEYFGPWEQIRDPRLNLMMALEIWRWHQDHQGCGWGPWSRAC
jgi:hypothetical protein